MSFVELTPEEYQECLKTAPHASLWQSLAWKGYQESLGRETRLYGLRGPDLAISATALVIIDKTAFGLSTWDIPRGPLWTHTEAAEELLMGIVEEARKERCMALYFSPPEELTIKKYKAKLSRRSEQPEATLVLDLTLPEDTLLAQMKPKGRYNISVAKKHGVSIQQSEDIDAFYTLLKGTGRRDSFGILPQSHYEHFLRGLPGSFLFLAYTESNEPIAGLMGVTWNQTGFYYYGASNYAERALMAPYLLQWEAIRLCREKGCTQYDLLGIAPAGIRYQVSGVRNHPWAGVTQFKKQFGGQIIEYPKEREITLKPLTKKALLLKRKFSLEGMAKGRG